MQTLPFYQPTIGFDLGWKKVSFGIGRVDAVKEGRVISQKTFFTEPKLIGIWCFGAAFAW